MRQRVGKKIYDTERDIILGETDNSLSIDDSEYVYEVLCKSRKYGILYLCMWSGNITEYAPKWFDRQMDNIQITELTLEEAYQWCMQNLPENKARKLWEPDGEEEWNRFVPLEDRKEK